MNMTAYNLETWLTDHRDDLTEDEETAVEKTIAIINKTGE